MIKTLMHRVLPRRATETIYTVLLPFFRAELPYLEFHVTDHCNMNCKGCFHYCPIASEHFADLTQYTKDIRRLAQLFRNITKIRIMGGEPLLHPDVAGFITASRSAFPLSNIHVVTNGTLLPKAPQAFWDACKATNTDIHMSVYPPSQKRVADYSRLCDSKGVRFQTKDMGIFYAHDNLSGDSSKEEAFDACRKHFFCPFLQNGRLHVCFKPALIHYFNRQFGISVPTDNGIDIHAFLATGKRIMEKLHSLLKPANGAHVMLYPTHGMWAAGF